MRYTVLPVEAIIAVANNGVIGQGEKIPWHHRGDLQRFKRLTMGHCLFMGVATFLGLARHYTKPGAQVLPGRTLYVVGRTRDSSPEKANEARGYDMGFPESALLHELKSQAPEIDFSNVIPIFSQPDGFRPVPSSISDGAISDLDYALSSLPPGKKLFISGGARVYQRYLPYVKRAHLTVIEANVEGDVILDTQSRTMLGMFGLTGQWNTIKFENTEEFKGLSASYFTLEM